MDECDLRDATQAVDQPPAVGELGGAIAAAKAWWKNSGKPSSSASLPSRPTKPGDERNTALLLFLGQDFPR